MLSVAIPFVGQHHVTKRCLEVLIQHAGEPLQIILIDNGSPDLFPLRDVPSRAGNHVTYLRNPENLGTLESLRQALDAATEPVLVHMHNDVLIHEDGWDRRIREAFEADPQLALAGFFGAPTVGPDGGRVGAHSNMVGLEWGSAWTPHGAHLTDLAPACIFDSLCMIWRVAALRQIGIPDDYPPHHWYDRLLSVRTIDAGWHAATIGIAFDHAGSLTHGKPETQWHAFADRWCRAHGIDPGDNSDHAVYHYGETLFVETYGRRLPLTIGPHYQALWAEHA